MLSFVKRDFSLPWNFCFYAVCEKVWPVFCVIGAVWASEH